MTLAERDKQAHRLQDMHGRFAAYMKALESFRQHDNLRQLRRKMLKTAYELYGSEGSLIAGCEREHWPSEVKEMFRANAMAITEAFDNAYIYWRQSGRHTETFRRYLETEEKRFYQ